MSSTQQTTMVRAGQLRRLLTRDDAAAYLGLAPRTLDKWAVLGIGPRYRRIGGRAARYDVGDLDNFIATAPAGGGPVRPAA